MNATTSPVGNRVQFTFAKQKIVVEYSDKTGVQTGMAF